MKLLGPPSVYIWKMGVEGRVGALETADVRLREKWTARKESFATKEQTDREWKQQMPHSPRAQKARLRRNFGVVQRCDKKEWGKEHDGLI